MSKKTISDIASLSLLENVEEFAQVGGWEYNLITGELIWTKETFRIHGLPVGATPDVANAINYYALHDRKRIEKCMEQAIASKGHFDAEFEFYDENKQHKWVRSYGCVTLDKKGEVEGLRGFFQDISKQKKMHLELIEKNENLASYEVGLNKYAIVVKTNRKGKIIYANDKFCEISKYERIELLDKDHRILNSGHHPKAFFETMWSELEAGKQWRGKIKNKAKDNSFYWVDTTITPITGQDGKIKEFLAFRFDITKEKEYEELVKKERDHANTLARAKSDFLANMSHEIRTPMNGIMGMLSLLEDTKLNSEQREMLINAKQSSSSLLVLLNDLLDFSKTESNKIKIANEQFNLKNALADIHFIYSKLAQEKGYHYSCDIDSSLNADFRGDIHRIRQVLNNLLSNAIKFTSDGSVILSINTVEENESVVKIKFTIKDTGLGIKESYHKNLFDVFSQEDETISRRYGGTGLGLSICKSLVEAMEGKLEFTSKVGHGSSFFFTIPLVKSQPLMLNPEVNDHTILLRDKLPLSILVAEDNEMNRKVIMSFLKKMGYESDYAENGEVAVEKALKHNYDLILMDMQMPVLDGLSATIKIVQHLKSKAPVIVALTANAFESDKQDCFEAGMSYFIEKPLKRQALFEMIEELFLSKLSETA